jgi:hypothetical protein
MSAGSFRVDGLGERRLPAAWCPKGTRPTGIWLTNLLHADTDELIASACAQTGTGGVVQPLRERFGLSNFEGRSFPGASSDDAGAVGRAHPLGLVGVRLPRPFRRARFPGSAR